MLSIAISRNCKGKNNDTQLLTLLLILLSYDIVQYRFVVDSYDSTSVRVQPLEALRERLEHDAALDEIIKLHRIHILTIEYSRTHSTEIHRPI